jgi:hypothetical protein
MFASLELGKDDTAMQQQGLSLQKNPLFVSIVDGCETLKALVEKGKITPEIIAGCKGLILMRTDKVFMHAFSAAMLNRICCQQSYCVLQIGFGISVTQGYGLVLLRQLNSSSGW